MFYDRQAGSSGPRAVTRGHTLSRLWAVLAFLTFFAFSEQAYLIQVHELDAQIEKVVWGGKDQSPGPDHGAACPICQGLAASGSYLTPSNAGLPIPANQVARAELPLLSVIAPRAGPSHLWRGRAPPRP